MLNLARVLLPVAALVMTSCIHRVPPAKPIGAKITGTVTYEQRMALAPEAVIDVTFSDATKLNTAPIQLGHQSAPSAGKQVPIPFEIVYDGRQIVSDHEYIVEAKIRLNDRVLFATERPIPVLTQGRPSNVAIVVKPSPR